METDLEIVLPVVIKAGKKALEIYRDDEISTEFKTGGLSDPVSVADLAAEKILLAGILKHFPDDKIISEEAGELGPNVASRTWLLDPIDGTFNFLNKLDSGWSVAISLVEGGKTLLSINYFPALDEAVLTENKKLIKYEKHPEGDWAYDVEKAIATDKSLDLLKVAGFFDQTRSKKHPELISRLFQEIGIILTPVSGSQIVYGLLQENYDAWIIPDVEEWDWRPVSAVFEALGGTVGLVDGCGVAALTENNFNALSELIS